MIDLTTNEQRLCDVMSTSEPTPLKELCALAGLSEVAGEKALKSWRLKCADMHFAIESGDVKRPRRKDMPLLPIYLPSWKKVVDTPEGEKIVHQAGWILSNDIEYARQNDAWCRKHIESRLESRELATGIQSHRLPELREAHDEAVIDARQFGRSTAAKKAIEVLVSEVTAEAVEDLSKQRV